MVNRTIIMSEHVPVLVRPGPGILHGASRGPVGSPGENGSYYSAVRCSRGLTSFAAAAG